MADKTEVEKAQESYEKRLKEQEIQQHREVDKLEAHHHEVRKILEEQKKELLDQNDAMLGAIGRVHAENEALKKRIADLEPAAAKAKEELARTHKEFEREMEFAQQRAIELVEETKRKAQHEIDRLKEKLNQAQTRKKKA